MKLQLCIYLGMITSLKSETDKSCNRIKVGDYWYSRQVLWVNIGRPYNLNVHKATNTLFFSYSKPETYSDVDFQLGYYHIETKDYDTIAGIKGGCAIAIDQYNDIVYLGGSDGIYKYNMMTKIADNYKEKDKNIWSLFFKRNLFYISYPHQKLHIEIDGKFSIVKEFEDFEVDNFFVTSNNDIYFANKTGLFRYDSTKMRADLVNDLITVRQIIEDNEDNMYISTNTGVYVNTPFMGLKKIMDNKNVYGIAFDRHNNLIFSDDNSIIMLKFSEKGCEKDEIPHW